MAYSNYGAYIWKNGKDITKFCADIGFVYINNKWYNDLDIEDIDTEGCPTCGGHANLLLDDFCIEFYKIFEPTLIFKDGRRTQIKCQDEIRYTNKSLNLCIYAYYLGDENLWEYDVDFKEDHYCVIVGSCFGNGYDNYKISKYIKKHLYFDEQTTRRKYYRINTPRDIFIDTVINKLRRKDDLRYELWHLWYWEIKEMLKDLVRFRFKNVAWHWNEILDKIVEIYYLK